MEFLQLTHFISDDEITFAINKMIDEASWEIIICSPWIEDKSHVMDKIMKKAQEKTLIRKKKRIKFLILTRPPKKSANKTAIEMLKNLGASVFFDPELHAKLLIVDQTYIYVGSTNLTTRSFIKNHEAGIISESRKLVKTARKWVMNIRENLKFEEKIRPKPEEGFCIVCGIPVPLDDYLVRCKECWAKEKEGVVDGKYCHKCGKEHSSTSKDPLCNTCIGE